MVKLTDDIGLAGSVTEKLNDISSGCWNPESQPLAGKRYQRRSLKVPIAQTLCGKNQWILWQIEVGMDEETQLAQQEIKGELLILRPGGKLICRSVGSVRLV